MYLKFAFLWEATRIAFQSIFRNKLRTFLTLLGIIIGVASVMVVGAGIEGLETYVRDSVSRVLGSNSFVVTKFPNFGHVSREEWERLARRNKDIELSDVAFLKKHCEACDIVAGEVSTRKNLYFGSEERQAVRIVGATANRVFLGSQDLEEGRYFTEEEVRRSRSVTVIGWEVKEEFFANRDPIGQTIKMGAEPLRVIGVWEKLGSSFGNSLDNHIHIPITTFQKNFGRRRSITIRGTAHSRTAFEDAVAQARIAMRLRHRLEPREEDDFGLTSTEEINSQVDDITGMIAMVIVPITAISLLVGGIVVMNIMLVSVTERTFEIGLRKSLGARRKDILIQFLIESFAVAAAGGLIGLALAAIVARIVEAATPMTMTITLGYILLAVGVSGGIGIIFGIYPAFTAARLNPIEALRAER